MAEQRNNSGAVFPNDRKESERHPDFKGKALVDGQWFWVSCWNKEGRTGSFVSMSFEAMTPEQVDQYCSGERRTEPRPAERQPLLRQSRGPTSRPVHRREEPMPEPPFGAEPVFTDAEIPFRSCGRSTDPL